MKEFGIINDTIYPKTKGEKRIRKTVRALLLRKIDEGLEVFLLHISGEDKFGSRDHFETPGGGIEEGETFEETLFREIKEETGYLIGDYRILGSIGNEYHLINQLHLATYFIAYAKEFVGQSLLDYEKDIIDGGKWYPLEEALRIFQSYPTKNIGLLIHKRESLMLQEAMKTFHIK